MSKHLERYNLESLLELCVRKPNHSFFRTGPTTPNLVTTLYHQRAEFPLRVISAAKSRPHHINNEKCVAYEYQNS